MRGVLSQCRDSRETINGLTKRTILAICADATGAEAVSCNVLLHRVDGRCSLAVSAAVPNGHREREPEAPAHSTGGMPPWHDGKSASPPCRPPMPQGRMDGLSHDSPSVVRNDSRAAKPVRFRHPAPAVARCNFSRRYPVVADGRGRLAIFLTRRHEDVFPSRRLVCRSPVAVGRAGVKRQLCRERNTFVSFVASCEPLHLPSPGPPVTGLGVASPPNNPIDAAPPLR